MAVASNHAGARGLKVVAVETSEAKGMVEPLEHVDSRQGREVFALIAGLATAMTITLLWHGDYGQAFLPGMVAVSCIQPLRTRPSNASPILACLAGILGIALFIAIRFGVLAFAHWHG